MTCMDDEAAAGMSPRDGQASQNQPQGSTPSQIPSSAAWDLPLAQAQEIAYAALRLYEGLEAEPWKASYHLEMRLQAFQQRMIDALPPQPKFDPQPPADQGGVGAFNVSAAESAASTPAEARERVAVKRAARRAALESRPFCDVCGNPAEYDAKTTGGPWAYLCDACFKEHTSGKLGVGLGQRLMIRGEMPR